MLQAKLKKGKAGGPSSILPEIVKASSEGKVFLKLLVELVKDV